MKTNPDRIEEQIGHFRKVLRKAGVKLTHQRLVIFREVARSGDHPDAITIHRHILKKIPTVSLDTVYRTLWLLADLGLITTLGPPHGGARFDANMHSHHHFICTNCGLAHDFYSEEFDQLTVPASVGTLGTVNKRQVELRGLCSKCARKKKQSICQESEQGGVDHG